MEETQTGTGGMAPGNATQVALCERRVLWCAARTALAARYDYACQVCGRSLKLLPSQSYAEVHALMPPGPVEPAQIGDRAAVVLCPQHHVAFDLGVLAIDPETLLLAASDPRDALHGGRLALQRHDLDPEALRVAWAARVIVPEDEYGGSLPRHLTIEALIEDLFGAALDEDEDRGFDRYLRVLEGGLDMPNHGRVQHRQFNWAQLRRRTGVYLEGGDPRGFEIVRTQPAEIDARVASVRVMIARKGASPAPVVVVRGEDGCWRMEFCGL